MSTFALLFLLLPAAASAQLSLADDIDIMRGRLNVDSFLVARKVTFQRDSILNVFYTIEKVKRYGGTGSLTIDLDAKGAPDNISWLVEGPDAKKVQSGAMTEMKKRFGKGAKTNKYDTWFGDDDVLVAHSYVSAKRVFSSNVARMND